MLYVCFILYRWIKRPKQRELTTSERVQSPWQNVQNLFAIPVELIHLHPICDWSTAVRMRNLNPTIRLSKRWLLLRMLVQLPCKVCLRNCDQLPPIAITYMCYCFDVSVIRHGTDMLHMQWEILEQSGGWWRRTSATAIQGINGNPSGKGKLMPY